MIFEETPLAGAFVISLDQREDDRGFFSRAFCTQEFVDHGLKPVGVQCNLAANYRQGTLRGLHYQIPRRRKQSSFAAFGGQLPRHCGYAARLAHLPTALRH